MKMRKIGIASYTTYQAWRAAVIKLGGKAGMYGDKDIGGARKWSGESRSYYAEWDGAHGEIETVQSEENILNGSILGTKIL